MHLPEQRKLFALDIGTRSVVGIILEEQGDEKYHVSEVKMIEHSERSMLDGQIHDVLSVSKIISQIKQELEVNHGPLKKVSVAAAGRALKTERAQVSVNIAGKPMMQKQDILHFELSAVQKAQATVAEKFNVEKSHYYYCVGYSVLYYRLDGEEIGSLIDQQGEEASVEIIATFLPKVVVESLIAALHRSGLEMKALTLEPIAAINVLIPPSMRRLNVALVDIGAGTSDIALTDEGTVIAYGMVPVAGDEITEALSDQFLLDFPIAEEVKRSLSHQEVITITDILGFDTEMNRNDVLQQIEPAIDKLATSICDEILLLNNNVSPKAVMLVGGGSLTPELPIRIAKKLNLPPNRVAIRGIDAISGLTFAEHLHKGPELVTPIGIAIAAKKAPIQYITIYMNDQPVRLFEMKKLTVGDCLLAAGIKMNKLFGKPGMAKIITLNGKNITIPGQHGTAPVLLKNGHPCTLDDTIENGDHLSVEKGQDGNVTELKINDLIDHIPSKTVKINGEEYEISAKFICNGEYVDGNKLIQDRDEIRYEMPNTIEELLHYLQLHDYVKAIQPFHIKLNGRDLIISDFSGKIVRNGIEGKPHSSFEHHDEIIIEAKQPITVRQLADYKQINLVQKMPVTFNETTIYLEKIITHFNKGDEQLCEDDLLFDGDEVIIEQKRVEPFIFQDVFKHVEIDMPANANGRFILMKNDKETSFHEQIAPGDHLKIVWPLVENKSNH